MDLPAPPLEAFRQLGVGCARISPGAPMHWRPIAARAVARHPEQGWSLLCNGVVLFDDGGALLPGGRAVPPACTPMVAAA